jgi:hypothetical protein
MLLRHPDELEGLYCRENDRLFHVEQLFSALSSVGELENWRPKRLSSSFLMLSAPSFSGILENGLRRTQGTGVALIGHPALRVPRAAAPSPGPNGRSLSRTTCPNIAQPMPTVA